MTKTTLAHRRVLTALLLLAWLGTFGVFLTAQSNVEFADIELAGAQASVFEDGNEPADWSSFLDDAEADTAELFDPNAVRSLHRRHWLLPRGGHRAPRRAFSRGHPSAPDPNGTDRTPFDKPFVERFTAPIILQDFPGRSAPFPASFFTYHSPALRGPPSRSNA